MDMNKTNVKKRRDLNRYVIRRQIQIPPQGFQKCYITQYERANNMPKKSSKRFQIWKGYVVIDSAHALSIFGPGVCYNVVKIPWIERKGIFLD